MILLPCPNCGLRDASEFVNRGWYGARPDPNQVSVEQWRAYLYLQHNPAGWAVELWLHRAGCGGYAVLERHTVSNEVRAARPASVPAGDHPGDQRQGRGS